MDASELGRQLAAQRKRGSGACAFCGVPISGLARRRYCSHEHAVAGYWREKREHLNAKRRERYQHAKAQRPTPSQAPEGGYQSSTSDDHDPSTSADASRA